MSMALVEPLPCNKATQNNFKSIERALVNLTQPEFVLFCPQTICAVMAKIGLAPALCQRRAEPLS